MSEELKSIENIVKNKSVLTYGILILIIFLILVMYRNISVWISLVIIFILSIIVIFFSYIYYKIIKKEKSIEIEEIEKKEELENASKERIEKDIIKESLEKINPDLSRFFCILENEGIKLLRDIEEEIKKVNTKVYFVVESAEKTNPTLKNSIGGTTFFTYFMNKLSKEYNIFRIKIFGTNTFLIISKNGLSSEKIIKEYYISLKEEINKILNDGRISVDNKEKVKEWYENLLRNNKPIILITQPYIFSLLSLINMLLDRIPKKEYNRLFSETNNLTRKKIKIYNIKISYLLKAVEFDDEIIKKFEKKETELIKNIANRLQIKISSTNYFSALMSEKNFVKDFEDSMNEIDKDFFNLIKNKANYKRLKALIDSIQINIFNLIENDTNKTN